MLARAREKMNNAVETERQVRPKQIKVTPATVSIDDIKQRYQAVQSKISALGLYPHLYVSKIACSFLSIMHGDESLDDQIPQLDKQLFTLEEYVNSADVQMTEVGEGGSQKDGGEPDAGSATAPIDTRFNIFRHIALRLCTTPQLSSHVPLADFLEMVNSNIMGDRKFDEGESAVILARMSQLREVRWDQSKKTVRRP
jgi:hypothetical protein